MPAYQQKHIAHKEHAMESYPDGNFRFCRYYGCGHTEAWDKDAQHWRVWPERRRKPAGRILRLAEPRQQELFPVSNAEAARILVQRAGNRSRRRVG